MFEQRTQPHRSVANRLQCWFAAVTLAMFIASQAWAGVWFVDSRVAASGTGVSWPQAKKTVGEAITAAAAGDEIWVATGAYVQSITLKQGVALYGGFSGTETQREQRDAVAYPVQLLASAGQFQAVFGNAVADIRVDGFIVRGGSQAGLRLMDVGASSVIANCVFSGNPGEGIRCYRAHPLIVDSVIHNNGDDGIYCYYGSPRIERCTIAANTTCGILSDYGSPTVVDSFVVGNVQYGVGLNGACQPVLTNCLLAGNAWNALNVTGTSLATVLNCSFVSNTPSGMSMGGAIATANSARFTARNTVFFNNSGTAVKENCAGLNEVSNCLFRDNPSGDYFDNERWTKFTGAIAINSNVVGASGTVDGDPCFSVVAGGTWTAAPTYASATCRTTFTDASAAFEPGALVGLLINCDTTQRRCGLITANTETTIEAIVSDTSSYVQIGDSYTVTELRLREDSACVDNGIGTDAPSTDLDGLERPWDVPERGADGSGAEYDIGPYEYQPDYGYKTLTIMGVEGPGIIAPAQGGVYAFGTSIPMLATPRRGCTFEQWVIRQHVDPPIVPVERVFVDSSFTLSMGCNWDVWAYFSGTPLCLLSLSAQGPGTVAAVPPGGTYAEDSVVTVEATPDAKARFVRWEGSAAGAENPVTLTMDEDKSVTAVFVARYDLTTAAYGGTVLPASGTFDDGEVVSLTAAPGPGWEFSHWEGAVSGTDNPISVTMDADKTVRAVFAGTPPDLRVASIDALSPARLKPGQPMTVQWRVSNVGLFVATASWVDGVYLSRDAVLDPRDKPLGEAQNLVSLAPSETYAQPLSITVPCPDVAPGEYRIIVRADAEQNVLELDESTAQTASAPTVVVDGVMSAP